MGQHVLQVILFQLTNSTKIKDIMGREVPALKVFQLSIKYLKDHFMRHITKSNPLLESADVMWMLTVPAIWDDKAKQFMRLAAEQVPIYTVYADSKLNYGGGGGRGRKNFVRILVLPYICFKELMWKGSFCLFQSGIKRKQLTIVLEPEAACLYCRIVPVDVRKDDTGVNLRKISPGTTYMILDSGGTQVFLNFLVNSF